MESVFQTARKVGNMTGTLTNVFAPRDTKLIAMENVFQNVLNTPHGTIDMENVNANLDMTGKLTTVRRATILSGDE